MIKLAFSPPTCDSNGSLEECSHTVTWGARTRSVLRTRGTPWALTCLCVESPPSHCLHSLLPEGPSASLLVAEQERGTSLLKTFHCQRMGSGRGRTREEGGIPSHTFLCLRGWSLALPVWATPLNSRQNLLSSRQL